MPSSEAGRSPQQTSAATTARGPEKRRYFRFDTSVDLEYRALTLNPIFGKALARDLSREGLRIAARDTFEVGSTVELRLDVPGDNLPVFVTGKVAWADGVEAGVRFTKISHDDRARMLEYAYRQWLETFKRNQPHPA